MKNKNTLSIIIGEQFKMNPPRWITSILDDMDSLQEKELEFLLKTDKSMSKIYDLKSKESDLKIKLKKISKLPRTKLAQKEIKKRIDKIRDLEKTERSNIKSISEKMKQVHKYIGLIEVGNYKSEKGEKVYNRKSDDALIHEKSTYRKFKKAPEVSNYAKKNIIGHLIQLSGKEYSEFPKEKAVQKRAILKLVVDGEDSHDPNVKDKIASLRAEWFKMKKDVLSRERKKATAKRKKKIAEELRNLVKLKKSKKIPKDCNKYIKSRYQRVANTDGVTFISTPYMEFGGKGYNGMLSDMVGSVFDGFIKSYRLKEESIKIQSVGILERVTK
jgi:hypothetical protein